MLNPRMLVEMVVKQLRAYRFYSYVCILLNFVRIFFVILAFRVLSSRIRDLRDARDFASSFSFAGISIRPEQVNEEIESLLRIVEEAKPRVVLEIGTAYGGTLFLFTRTVDREATIISIDLPGGPFGGGYPFWRLPLYKAFAHRRQKLHLIRADSHDTRTLERVKRMLKGKQLDFLFIDGDHRFEGVKRDFEMYSPLVRKVGIIAFHDIVPGPPENVGGVPRFWNEIKKDYQHTEIVKSWNQSGYGAGVLYV